MHVHAGHTHRERTGRVLRISLAVTALYIVLLVIAGIRAHSLALLSEAGHNLSDFLALLLSLAALYLESRPPSATKTYGYRRAGVLAALVNSLTLVLVAFFIFYEAFKRLQKPEQVHAGLMIWVAAAGVVMNGVIALLLWRSGRDVNIRSAVLHEIGDTLSTAAVIAGGWAPDKLRRHASVTGLVRQMNAARKPLGIICHGGLVAISADIVRGRRATGSLGIKDDLVNAGATWVDQPAFRDGNLIWGRVVADIPAFCRELVPALAEYQAMPVPKQSLA